MSTMITEFLDPMVRAVHAARSAEDFDQMSDDELARQGVSRTSIPQVLARTMGWTD